MKYFNIIYILQKNKIFLINILKKKKKILLKYLLILIKLEKKLM